MTSGQLENFGILENWSCLKSFLIPANTKEDEENDDWSWNEEDTPSAKPNKTKEEQKKADSWTQKCVFAHSPMGDVIVAAHQSRAVFFTSEWDAATSRTKFSKSFQGTLAQEEGEVITSALCMPLVSKKKSSPGVPDWTCVLVGFSSGYVRVYTENGSNLINQQFHNQRVASFKCRSYQPAYSSSDHDQLEEIFVLYESVIVTMDGFGLFQTLRACRNHLARIQANATETTMDPPPLTYKKWQYENEEPANDCESVGLFTPGTFDHLFNGSVLGGFHAKCKAVPLTSYIFVSAGKKPYTAFHYAQEGQAIPVLTEIAYAMASKLKSSLINAASGWLGFGGGSKAPPPKEKPQIEPVTSMSSRFGLVDPRRVGQTVSVSPCRKLSAITDSLGRVALLDNNLGITVRKWKGYRDAQVGWLQVIEEVTSRNRRGELREGRKALFLVIYAPRRGHLEVFAMQQGPKVATFNVARNGKLLCTTFGMMGLNNIPIKGGNVPSLQCLFIDAEASLFTLSIPFHLILCDKTSSKLKDVHLLKTMQKILKENPRVNAADIMEILNQVRTQSMINQAFKILAYKCKSVEVIRDVLEMYLKQYCDDDSKDLTIIFRLQALGEFYIFLTEAALKPPEYSETMGSQNADCQDLTILRCLHASSKEMKALQDMAEINCTPKAKMVKFEDENTVLTINDFFASLSLEFDVNKLKSKGDNSVKLNQKFDLINSLGALLFLGVMNNQSEIEEWQKRLRDSGLIPREIILLSLKHWSETALRSSSYVDSMKQLYHVLSAISQLDATSTVNEVSRVNKWWEEVRKEITRSYKIFHNYSFALVCRGVAVDLLNQAELAAIESGEKEKKPLPVKVTDGESEAGLGTSQASVVQEEVASSDDMEGWENISFENVKWNILLKQIEDLSVLSTILYQRPKLVQPALPLLSNEIEQLSVLNLLDKGKGCIAELVGKWLTVIGLDPVLIQDDELPAQGERPSSPEPSKYRKMKQDDENDEVMQGIRPDEPDKELDKGDDALAIDFNNVEHVRHLLRKLKENFSISLSSSIILANYCWEYCLEWNKDTNEVLFLDAAMKCIFAIPSPHIKQGMMSMMWSTFLVKKFAVSASVGKLAKDKFVEKPSSFTSWETEESFLRNCVAFMDNFMEVNVLCDGTQPPKKYTSTKSHWSNDMASASLTDLAIMQNPTNYEMLLLHYQLTLVAHCLHKFRIKKSSMKTTSLFDTKSRMMFFMDLSAQAPFSNVEVDLALKALREEFLCLVISNAIHEIPEELKDDDPRSASNDLEKSLVPSLEGVQDCDSWIRKCFDLCKIWGMDLDCLRINQICEFYSCGFDLLGLELISSVTAKDVLGSKLLVIVGMRINYIIEANPENVTEIVSSLSTNLSSWLKSLNYSKLRCLRFTKLSITELTQQLIQLIPESAYDYKLAEELLHSGNFL